MAQLWLILRALNLACIPVVPISSVLNFQQSVEIFSANAGELSQPGVHSIGDVVFSAIVFPETKDADGESDIGDAVNALLESRIRSQLGVVLPTATAPERAFYIIARSCLGKIQSDLKGLEVVRNEVVGDQRVVVVAVPQEQLNGIQVSRDFVLNCLHDRLIAGTLNHVEAMVLLESLPKDIAESKLTSVKESVIALFDRELGDGVSATIQGRWTRHDGSQLQAGLRGWQGVIQTDIDRDQGGNIVLRGMKPQELDRLTSEECFQFLGQFANDPVLLERVRTQLKAAGWTRTAALFDVKSVAIPIVKDKPGSLVPQVLRAKIAATQAMTFLLLTGGLGSIEFKAQESQLCKDARVAFNKKTSNGILDPEGPQEAVILLQQDLEAGASYDSVILLSATLLALKDQALAYPLAKASFVHNSGHPFAGVNLLLAARALDLRDEVRELLPEIESQAKLDDWGRSEIRSIRDWVNVD